MLFLNTATIIHIFKTNKRNYQMFYNQKYLFPTGEYIISWLRKEASMSMLMNIWVIRRGSLSNRRNRFQEMDLSMRKLRLGNGFIMSFWILRIMKLSYCLNKLRIAKRELHLKIWTVINIKYQIIGPLCLTKTWINPWFQNRLKQKNVAKKNIIISLLVSIRNQIQNQISHQLRMVHLQIILRK